jgi:hypothetical protein
MKRRTKITSSLGAALLLLTCGIAFIFFSLQRQALREYFDQVKISATPFNPNCPSDDQGCLAWTEFRRTRPYPYQGVAAKALADGSLVIILSEPATVLAKSELQELAEYSRA